MLLYIARESEAEQRQKGKMGHMICSHVLGPCEAQSCNDTEFAQEVNDFSN